MNPIRLLRIYSKANRLLTLFEQATRSYERTHDVSKSLFLSKIFWVQVLTVTVELSNVLPLPAGTVAAIGGVATILLRTITDQPVHVVPRP